jgi:hypothetical protein
VRVANVERVKRVGPAPGVQFMLSRGRGHLRRASWEVHVRMQMGADEACSCG